MGVQWIQQIMKWINEYEKPLRRNMLTFLQEKLQRGKHIFMQWHKNTEFKFED